MNGPPVGFYEEHWSNGEERSSGMRPAATLEPDSAKIILERWRLEGPLVRVATGIAPLDELCRGGWPIPWRVIIIGAPAAGKTFISTVIADTMARRAGQEGLSVGILAVDEEPDDVTVRLAQMAGFTVAQIEQRDPGTLDAIARALVGLDLVFYDSRWTIEQAAMHVAARASVRGKRGALFIDSIHAARSGFAPSQADSPRLVVAANVEAVRTVAGEHRLLVVATGEANRASYRADDSADTTNDLAAGAESRSTEFVGQTLMMVRTPKGHADIGHVRLAKNRRAKTGEFWLRYDRERHRVDECADPSSRADEDSKARSEGAKVDALVLEVERLLLTRAPVRGLEKMRDQLRESGVKYGNELLGVAVARLERLNRLENRGTEYRPQWYLRQV